MMTVRQISRLWIAKSYPRLSQELLVARQEASFEIKGLDRPCAVAALAVIRMDELSQSHLPLYSSLVRSVMAAAKAAGSSPATKVVSTPKRRKLTSSWVVVPP